jgi:hypothetical protein
MRLVALALTFAASILLSDRPHATIRAAEDEGRRQQEANDAEVTPKPQEVPSQEELFRRFEERLTGSQLIGYFTTRGQETEKPLQADKYTIEKVKKGKGDFWLFEARIQYNNQDVKMPMPLEVKWAGDTPVITLTQVFVPGLGTFTARVLIYGDEYAGTWSAGDHGGHMFGRIVKADAVEDQREPSAKSGD